jgi:hypothetical protein
MSDLQHIQTLLKEISELLQENKKSSKRKAINKLRAISNIATITADTLDISINKG